MAEIKRNPLARCEVGYDGSIRFFEEEIGENDCLPMPIAFLTPERLYEVVRAVIARLLDRSLPGFVPFEEPLTAAQQGRKTIRVRLRRILPSAFRAPETMQDKAVDREQKIRQQREEHDANQLQSLTQSLEPFRGVLTQSIRERAVASGEQGQESKQWKTVKKVKVASGTGCDIVMNLHPSRVEATKDGARIVTKMDAFSTLTVSVPKRHDMDLKYGLDGLWCSVKSDGKVEMRVTGGGATLQVLEPTE